MPFKEREDRAFGKSVLLIQITTEWRIHKRTPKDTKYSIKTERERV